MTAPPSTYPIKGIFYFFSNWSLVRRIIGVFLLLLVVSLLVLGLTFGFLLSLQAHALIVAHCPAWLAWTVSVIFCLLEAGVFTLIFYLILLPVWQDALFDDVLRLKGLSSVLDQQKTVSELTICCRGCCSGLALALISIYAIVFIQILTLLITIPLHIIPVFGTLIYCYINGWVWTWGHQLHYHIGIKEWSLKQSLNFALKNHEDYLSIGFIAVLLEIIPIANLLFLWTNVVGAALWTADVILEEQNLLSRANLANNEAGSSSYQAADGSSQNYGSTDP